MFENAKWITRTPSVRWGFEDDPAKLPPSPYLARTFTVKKPLKTATLSAAGLGQAAYFLNGARLPDSHRPTDPTAPIKAVIYRTFDLSALLHEGQNRFGAMLGNNGYNDPRVVRFRGVPMLIAQIDLAYTDGTTDTVVTDTAFKTADAPVLFSLRRCGEKYDARREIDGWCAAGFDDSDWENAHICAGPGGVLRPTVCPPERIVRRIAGSEIAKGVFDFGENVSGHVAVTVRGKRGSEIEVRYAELLTADGRHVDQGNILADIYKPMAHKDVYILKGDGEEHYAPLFSYHGFRYAEVTGDFESVALTAEVAHTDLAPAAAFSCDNGTLAALHDITVRSVLTNCHGALTDCPHREQNEWTGDGLLSAEAVCIAFDAYDLFYEWMQKFKEDQLPDGRLPCIIPMKNGVWETAFANGPDWDSAIFYIPYYAYRYSGDRRIVELVWENMERTLRHFATLSETCLLRAGVGDWASAGATCDKQITDTAYYATDAQMMAEMAAATGRDPAPFAALFARIRDDFRAAYVKNGEQTDTHQTTLAAAIFAGFLTEKEKKAAGDRLAAALAAADHHFVCGVHGLRFIFDALCDTGHVQELFDTVVNPAYPGFGNIVARGMTTLPEWFNYGASQNHHFRSPVDAWLFNYLAGIRPVGFGMETVRIAPQFVRGVTTLKATVHGVTVSYDEKTLTVQSPVPFTLCLNGEEKTYPAGEWQVAR